MASEAQHDSNSDDPKPDGCVGILFILFYVLSGMSFVLTLNILVHGSTSVAVGYIREPLSNHADGVVAWGPEMGILFTSRPLDRASGDLSSGTSVELKFATAEAKQRFEDTCGDTGVLAIAFHVLGGLALVPMFMGASCACCCARDAGIEKRRWWLRFVAGFVLLEICCTFIALVPLQVQCVNDSFDGEIGPAGILQIVLLVIQAVSLLVWVATMCREWSRPCNDTHTRSQGTEEPAVVSLDEPAARAQVDIPVAIGIEICR